MITLRQSPFDLLDRLEQQVSQAERVPAAEVIENKTGYIVRLELPGVDHDSIDVKATDRSLVVALNEHPPSPKKAPQPQQKLKCNNFLASSAQEHGVAVFVSPSPSIAIILKRLIATAFLKSRPQKVTTALQFQ